jgi:hypothetical protein
VELRRLPVAALILAGCLGAGRAAAQPGKGQAAAMPTIEIASDVETGEARAPAPDQRTKHLYFAVSGGVTGVAGSVAANTPSMSVAGTGFTFGGLIGIGIARYGTFQIFGDRTLFAGPAICSDKCAGSAFTVGMGITYHIAQALAFDPWGSFGVAYRQSTFYADPLDSTHALRHYQGIDVARIAFGGDFYPTPFFGFGPFIEADFGTNLRTPKLIEALPPDIGSGPRTYAIFQLGVRVAFDPLRKGAPSPAAAARRKATSPSIGLSSPAFGGTAPGF